MNCAATRIHQPGPALVSFHAITFDDQGAQSGLCRHPSGTYGRTVDFGVAPFPGNSILGGENLAISATTGKPRAAQALVEFLTNPRSQQILF